MNKDAKLKRKVLSELSSNIEYDRAQNNCSQKAKAIFREQPYQLRKKGITDESSR